MSNIVLRSLICIFLGTTILSGCSKDFINNIEPSDAAKPEDVFQSASSVRSYFNGIYRQMRTQWKSIDESAGDATDTWGYISVQLARSAKGKDVVLPFSSFYIFDYQNQNREPTYRRVRFTWYFFYELINQVNTLIDGTQHSEEIAEAEKTALIAEARALRAMLYFELIREFQFPITKNASAPGVPIYTTPVKAGQFQGKPRETVQKVYDQINSDIEFAVQHLGASRGSKNEINLNVAWGLAARIYLEQNRLEEAADAASYAIEGLHLDADGYGDNYRGLTSAEVIWGFRQTTQSGGQSLYYGNPSSFYEKSGEGYGSFYINSELASHFSDTDIRNSFYIVNDDPEAPDYLATNKFGAATQEMMPLISGEEAPWKIIDFDESVALMRVAEMYLIRAEALARLEDPTASEVLFELQKNRDPEAVPSGNSDEALIEEILLERRKELYGEMGVDWLDAKRLQLPIDRSVGNHMAPDNYVIPANDDRFNLKIPQSEIEANSSLSAADQNP